MAFLLVFVVNNAKLLLRQKVTDRLLVNLGEFLERFYKTEASASFITRLKGSFRALVTLCATVTLISTLPNSISLTYVLWMSALSANTSWDISSDKVQ